MYLKCHFTIQPIHGSNTDVVFPPEAGREPKVLASQVDTIQREGFSQGLVQQGGFGLPGGGNVARSRLSGGTSTGEEKWRGLHKGGGVGSGVKWTWV